MPNKKKILLGITASIAAYKSIFLLRLLTQHDFEVRVIMSPEADKFVSPLVLSTFSNAPVFQHLSQDNHWNNHIDLASWANIFLIAPLTANTLSKMAHGACDNLLLATYLSAKCKVIVAPAMDEEMWRHPATQENIITIQKHNVQVLDVHTGKLASGISGEGRMKEPQDILEHLLQQL